MKAIAVVPDEKRIELREVEPPRIMSPTDVKLRMLEVGVCGTDHFSRFIPLRWENPLA